MCSTAVNAKDRFAGAWPRMWHGRKTGHNRWRLVAWFNAAGRRVYIRGQSGAHLPARSFESNSRLVGTNIRQAGNQCRLEFVVAAIEQCIRCLLVVSIFSTSLVAVPALSRVEPLRTSGPTTGVIARLTSGMSSESALHESPI